MSGGGEVTEAATVAGGGTMMVKASALTVSGGTVDADLTADGTSQSRRWQRSTTAATIKGYGQVSRSLTLAGGQLEVDMAANDTSVAGNLSVSGMPHALRSAGPPAVLSIFQFTYRKKK